MKRGERVDDDGRDYARFPRASFGGIRSSVSVYLQIR